MITCKRTIDRRTAFTKQCFIEALDSLLIEENFENISIQSLCKRANRSRETFARNFNSLRELLDYRFEVVHQQIMEKIELEKNSDNIHDLISFYSYLVKVHDFLRGNKKFAIIISHDLPDLGIAFGRMNKAVANAIYKICKAHQGVLDDNDEHLRLFSYMVSSHFLFTSYDSFTLTYDELHKYLLLLGGVIEKK